MRKLHALSQAARAPNSFCEDDEVVDTDEDQECEDHGILGAATALHGYIQEVLKVSPSAAAAVVEGSPSYVWNLVVVTKQENEVDTDELTEDQFSQKVYQYLKSVGPNLLQPVLESIGCKGERLQDLLAQLSAGNVHSILSVINVLEKQGVPRSSLGAMISEDDAQVLLCTEGDIEAGFRTLRGLMIPEDEFLSLIQRYPLILKAGTISNISVIYDELEEFASRDNIIRRAVCNNPQHVHMYRKGCAKEVVEYLKSYDFTVFRLDQILQKHARLILTDVEKLKQNVQFLEDLGGFKDLVYKVINRCPNFLFYSLEDNLEAKLEYFKGLGFEEPDFCQVISRFPNLFSASLENKIKPAVEELRTLGLSDDGLKKVVLYRPSLFGYKLGGDISALVKQLKQSSYPEYSKVTAFIKLYSRGTEHKQRCEEILVQHGLSGAEAKEVLEKEPGILGYSEHVLNDKLESLKTFDIPVQTVLTVPEYLSFALRKRVQRRERVLSYMKSKGLLTGQVTLKQLVLHANTHFYNELVKPHSEDKELCKIWYRERDTARASQVSTET